MVTLRFENNSNSGDGDTVNTEYNKFTYLRLLIKKYCSPHTLKMGVLILTHNLCYPG